MTRIEQLRKIVEDKQFSKIDGFLMDIVTANLLISVYDGLTKPELKEKFNTISLPRLVDFSWKMVK